MTLLIIAIGCLSAGGVWLMVSAVWPAPPDSDGDVETACPDTTARYGDRPADPDAASCTAGGWALRHVRAGVAVGRPHGGRPGAVRRPPEVYAGWCVFCALAGVLAGPAARGVASGTPMPMVVPIWVMIVGAVVGWFVPRPLLHSEADTARADFRHALGAYLDVLVMLLAAQEGPSRRWTSRPRGCRPGVRRAAPGDSPGPPVGRPGVGDVGRTRSPGRCGRAP